ncbi:hypothetical protein [Oerskovia flava]|uniref:hypothetical protein n=1 Tax=Oerskovia flava TaxID=2986422 RepID=UPI002240AFE7|nr:hypothetical protein [Oerskovia sp. JB1-3-2]
MPAKAKTILMWLLIGFLLYAIITSPDRAADILQGVWDVIISAFRSIGQFFTNLIE